MALQGFDESYYLEAKLTAVRNVDSDWNDKTVDDLKEFMADYGMTPEQHYEQFGWSEGINPNAYFDGDEYIAFKAQAMVDANLYATTEAATSAFNAAWTGNPYDHFLAMDATEQINPSNAFDNEAYLASKLTQLQSVDATTYASWTTDQVATALADAGFSPLTHYLAIGYTEGITVTAVSTDEQVSPEPTGEGQTLTSGTDTLSGEIFNAPMVYTPDGSDRILSLQDEDTLTGTGTTNELNVTMGMNNADEGTATTITPYLNNIQNINIDWTGDTRTLDLRNANATEAININRVTDAAETVTVANIGTAAATVTVADVASDDTTVSLTYKGGVLDGSEDTMTLKLDNVLAESVTQTSTTNVEGFETVNLNATNGVSLQQLGIYQMGTLNITGSGDLKLANLTDSPVGTDVTPEFQLLGTSGIQTAGVGGMTLIDASTFAGNLTLDVTDAIGGWTDPSDSGKTVYGEVKGGTSDDTFYSADSISGTSDTSAKLDGGEGADKLVLVNQGTSTAIAVTENAEITNVESLELRNQSTNAVSSSTITADLDGFDTNLTSVVMRDESDANTSGATFVINNMTSDNAANGLVLKHSITQTGGQTPTVQGLVKDASGSDDSVTITVENDLNTTQVFDYTLNFDGDNGDNDTNYTDAAVENVTINDNDTESNIVTMTQAQEQTGTLTLTGGAEDDTFTINADLIAKTIEASTQLSDLRLTVGDTTNSASASLDADTTVDKVAQTINLGTGDDILTFINEDDFNASDTVTDAGGEDTIRAAFSEDATPELTGIENFDIVATDDVTINMANADVSKLVIMGSNAVDGDTDASPITAEPFDLTPQTTDVITLQNTSLSTLNFSGDLDEDDDYVANDGVDDDDWSAIPANDSTTADFNGVTLTDNTATDLTVNIDSSLDDVDYGAQAYNLGMLTAHGITSMSINVSDENTTVVAADGVTKFRTGEVCTTTIANVYSKTMSSLTVTAEGNVDLGIVSGTGAKNTLTTLDAGNVGGDFTADVDSLGNNAVVTLGDGDNDLDASDSAGKDVTITAGDGSNDITGTGQDDEITTGSGADVVDGDQGDNVIVTGAGNDTVTAKDGSDTYDVGSGFNTVVDNDGTGLSGSEATNIVSITGGTTLVTIDTDGAGGANVNQVMSAAEGDELSMSWKGAVLQDTSVLLNGEAMTIIDGGSSLTGDGVIAGAGVTLKSTGVAGTTSGVVTATGTSDADVVMWSGSAAGDGLTFVGGAGSDSAVGSIDNDTFVGGAGADKLAMQDTAATDGMADLVTINAGESTSTAYDQISGFQLGAAGLNAVTTVTEGNSDAGVDTLDLATATIAAGGAADGDDHGGIKSHSITNGIITFSDNDTYSTANSIHGVGTGTNSINNADFSLADVIAYLEDNDNIAAGETVAFKYNADGNNSDNDQGIDSTFVFQAGADSTTADTLVELNGVQATAVALATDAASTAGAVSIV